MGKHNRNRGAHAKHANAAKHATTEALETTQEESSAADESVEQPVASESVVDAPEADAAADAPKANAPAAPSIDPLAETAQLPVVAAAKAAAATAPLERVAADSDGPSEQSPAVDVSAQPTAPSEPVAQAAVSVPEIELDAGADDADGADDANGASEASDAAGASDAASAEEASDADPFAVEPIAPDDLGFDMAKGKKSHKALKVVGIVAGSIVGVAAAVYVAGALVFNNWFLPNTTLLGQDISLKSNEEVAAIIEDAVSDYTLSVKGGEFTYSTDAQKAGLTVDADAVVKGMHEGLGMWHWPLDIVEPERDLSKYLKFDYNEAALKQDVTAALEAFNATGTDPVDACVAYDDATHKFIVKPEEYGTKYDTAATLEAFDDAITSFEGKLTLERDQLVQPKAFSTDKKLNDDVTGANKLVAADITLKMGDVVAGKLNADQLHSLVIFDEVAVPRIDEGTLDSWITDFVHSLDTIGSERTYIRPDDGKEITVSGGSYGWNIVSSQQAYDDIMAAVKAGKATEVEIECTDTAEVFNGQGKPDWGKRYIDVDLSEQYVRFFDEDSDIIWETSCISGQPDGKHNTPTGVWFVNRKESPSKLIGWEDGKKIYESTVRYWMPFVGNEVGLHDADWQPAFGGSLYAQGLGSHGCVNLPVYMAAELYDIIELNDVVIVHY